MKKSVNASSLIYIAFIFLSVLYQFIFDRYLYYMGDSLHIIFLEKIRFFVSGQLLLFSIAALITATVYAIISFRIPDKICKFIFRLSLVVILLYCIFLFVVFVFQKTWMCPIKFIVFSWILFSFVGAAFSLGVHTKTNL